MIYIKTLAQIWHSFEDITLNRGKICLIIFLLSYFALCVTDVNVSFLCENHLHLIRVNLPAAVLVVQLERPVQLVLN